MAAQNKCEFLGRLTRNPEQRFTAEGKAVVNFSIAVYDGKNQEGEERALFVNCVAWNGVADHIMKFYKKGKPILISAKYRDRTWEDKDGAKRHSAEFELDDFPSFVPKDTSDNEEVEQESTPTPAKSGKRTASKTRTTVPPVNDSDDDEGIPF